MASTIIVSVATLDCTNGEGVVPYARVCKDKADAAKWIENDFNQEAGFHDWPKVQVTEAQIEDGFELKSPSNDSDHDYIWKVIFQPN